jgi:hypothetical protein
MWWNDSLPRQGVHGEEVAPSNRRGRATHPLVLRHAATPSSSPHRQTSFAKSFQPHSGRAHGSQKDHAKGTMPLQQSNHGGADWGRNSSGMLSSCPRKGCFIVLGRGIQGSDDRSIDVNDGLATGPFSSSKGQGLVTPRGRCVLMVWR